MPEKYQGPETSDDKAAAVPVVLDTGDLFGAAREINLSHRGEIYRLRITAQQKLILTK